MGKGGKMIQIGSRVIFLDLGSDEEAMILE